jgi:predicted transposase/invertase (TIGR01784 family)
LPVIKNLKASIIDVKAKDEKDNTYIIEMQVTDSLGLDKRLLYYASKEYAQQIESGEQYIALNPVIFIGIFEFRFTESPKYLSHHAVCNVEDGERVIKDMDFYFIELPKFDKPLTGLDDITDKWVYFIKNAENLSVIPENLEDEGLKEAYIDADKHNWSKEDLSAYDYAAMREQDERGKITAAEIKGRKAGKIEGKIEEKIEIARNLIAIGVPISDIAKATGLSVEDIEAL